MKNTTLLLAGAVSLVAVLWAAGAEPEVPLGSKDFYPSPERPIGFRGDGNGCFPGATPVTEWQEGTVATRKEGREEILVATDHRSHNVVWKSEMPSWANNQPIVVGDRVFTKAEPNLLVCTEAATGKVLWTVSANPWELAGLDRDRAERAQAMYDIWREVIPHFDRMWHDGTMTRRVPSREFEPIREAFMDRVLPRVLRELGKLDPEGKYDEAARVTMDALKQYSAALAEARDGHTPAVSKHDPLKGRITRLADTLARRIDGLAGTLGSGKQRSSPIPLEVPWGNLVGFCMSAPVSDGEYVYASFGQGQTVCVDLNGKRIWGVHYPPSTQKDNLSGIQSPLLAGNVLVVMQGGERVLRGLDSRTGKLLWEAPTRGEGAREGGGYYVGSHKTARLVHDGKAVDVILTTLCNIIRASDGRVLGALPFDFPPSGGPSLVCQGDIVVKGANGDNYRAPFVAYRLKMSEPDRAVAEEIWRTPRRTTPYYQAVVLTPTTLFMHSRDHTAMDLHTGKILYRSREWPNEVGGYSNLVAGSVFLWAEEGIRSWSRRGEEVFGTFGTADATDPAHIKILSNHNVLGGVNKPRLPAMEKYAPELYALPFYTGHSFGWPAHFLHTDTAVFPSGNRLFIRSLSHLYCIGDPKTPYDWSPESRPARIRAAMGSR